MAKFTNMPGVMRGMGTFSKIKEDAAFHGSKRQPSKAKTPPGVKVGDRRPNPKIKDVTPREPIIRGDVGFRPLSSSGGKRHFAN